LLVAAVEAVAHLVLVLVLAVAQAVCLQGFQA
jgi:hypothetical protein